MKRNLDVELARLLAFAAVVTAHGNSLGMFSQYPVAGYVIDELCRFCVQLFFMVSGFFWRQSQIDDPFEALKKLFPKIAIPFVLWAAIYLTLDATQLLYPQSEPRTFRSYAMTPWSGGIAFHLWFLPALFIGTGIGLTLIRYLGIHRALLVVLVLFLIGVVAGAYLRPFGINLPLSTYRNGVFLAPIFLVGGYYLKTRPVLPKLWVFSVMTVFGAALTLLEGIFVVHAFPHGHDLSLATLPYGVGAFGMFLHLNSSAEKLASWGRDVFGAYLAHVLFMQVIIQHLSVPSSPTTIALCIALTVVLSLGFSRLAKKNRWTQYLVP